MATSEIQISPLSATVDKDQRQTERAQRKARIDDLGVAKKDNFYKTILTKGEEALQGLVAGEVAFVTGAGGGIGLALLLAIHKTGGCQDLVLVGRRPKPLFDAVAGLGGGESFAAQCQTAEEASGPLATLLVLKSGLNALVISGCDVSNEAHVVGAFRVVQELIGSVTLLINNAGIGSLVPSEFSGGLTAISWEKWKTVMDVNIGGTFLCTKEALKHGMPDGASIVNISSKAGVQAFSNIAAYASSKWAMEGFTKCAALELAERSIRVNSISPGRVETPGFPAAPDADRTLFLLPEDVIVPFLYLCTASGITGTYMHAGEFMAERKAAVM